MTAAFKPKTTPVPFYASGFSGGGLEGRFGQNAIGTVTLDPNSERGQTISGLTGAADTAANTFGDLYNTVRPGFNDLLNARLAQINDASRAAIGDLRSNLASRRIMGSSFGESTVNRANAEFSRQRDQAIADNFLKSLDAQRQLTADQLNARLQSFKPKLDELNLEAGLAQQLGAQGSQQLAHNAEVNAQIQNQASASGLNALGSLLGTGLGFAKSFIPTGGFSSMFGASPVSAGSYGGIPYPIFG